MIESLAIDNIRLFCGHEWRFPFAPLTVICGTNSSGKSTLLKTLVLLRQSQGIRQGLGTGSGILQFVGQQVDLGNYNSFVSHNDTSKDIHIELCIRDVMPIEFFESLVRLQSEGKAHSVDVGNRNVGSELSYILRSTFSFSNTPSKGRSANGMCELQEADENVSEETGGGGVLTNASFAIVVDGADILSWTVKRVKSDRIAKEPHLNYELQLPQRYFKRLGGPRLVEVRADEKESTVCVNTMLRGLLPDRIFAKLRPGKTRHKGGDTESESWVSAPLPLHMEMALRDFHAALSGISYLGPLRSPAQRFYVSYAPDSAELDSSGAFVPTVLRSRGDSLVLNWRDGEVREETLDNALHYWLSFLRTGKFPSTNSEREIEIRTTRDVLIEIMVRSLSGEDTFALADSGFGYSQVIPILVRGLLAKQNNTLIVEQPELHLNPALQVRLGHFFTGMAHAGKQVLIETHSEHVVNSIRALSAEDASGKTPQLCKILYMSAEQGGGPKVCELSIRPDGTVPEWPVEFFGEAAKLAGRMLRAQRPERRLLKREQ